MPSTSVVIPVRDGERYLEELLDALAAERPDEILVIDSGSRDRSLEIARSAGVELLEIPPHEFGHGATRNLGAERTSGDLICFLTQDATPCAGWLAAYREAFALAADVGAAYGPHLPRPDTSPMIARELTEFFATFGAAGAGAQIQRGPQAPTFLSNVNACYARGCWEQIRFRDLAYSEDQAFGRELLAAGWAKVYQPSAAVLHAHDYGAIGFMRRYFDEYRGLRETLGHVPEIDPLATARHVAGSVAADRRWLAQRGAGPREQLRWMGRGAVHYAGQQVFSALGARADRLPRRLRERLSLEGRGDAAATAAASPGISIRPSRERTPYASVAAVWRGGPTALLDPVPGMADRDRLRIAMIAPAFGRGSGGHNILLQLLSRLERAGHVCSLWIEDIHDERRQTPAGVLRRELREQFAPFDGPVYKGLDQWQGADVAIATGWQTVHPALLLDACRARVYLVNDHEPEFFATSAERIIAEDTYRHGLPAICGTPWLRDLVSRRYGVAASAFTYGVDHAVYRPADAPRRADTVVFYARDITPRRGVPLGLMALEELHRTRPELRIALYGQEAPVRAAFPYVHLGLLSGAQLAALYREATVGLCLSLTNFSLSPKEMLACGLPCVELAGVSAESVFGPGGPIELAPLDPSAIAQAIARLIDDRELWEERSRAGIEFVADHTWDRATAEVEAALRGALRERERTANAKII